MEKFNSHDIRVVPAMTWIAPIILDAKRAISAGETYLVRPHGLSELEMKVHDGIARAARGWGGNPEFGRWLPLLDRYQRGWEACLHSWERIATARDPARMANVITRRMHGKLYRDKFSRRELQYTPGVDEESEDIPFEESAAVQLPHADMTASSMLLEASPDIWSLMQSDNCRCNFAAWNQEILRRLPAVIKQLPEADQLALRMYFGFDGEDLTPKEISERLGMGRSSVHRRIAKARMKVLRLLMPTQASLLAARKKMGKS